MGRRRSNASESACAARAGRRVSSATRRTTDPTGSGRGGEALCREPPTTPRAPRSHGHHEPARSCTAAGSSGRASARHAGLGPESAGNSGWEDPGSAHGRVQSARTIRGVRRTAHYRLLPNAIDACARTALCSGVMRSAIGDVRSVSRSPSNCRTAGKSRCARDCAARPALLPRAPDPRARRTGRPSLDSLRGRSVVRPPIGLPDPRSDSGRA